MLRRSIHLLIATLLFCGSVTGRLCGEEPFTAPTKVNNAALLYWQAFALLPELSEKDTKLLNNLEKGSGQVVDARSLLKGSKTAMRLISHLTPDTPCRWEFIENGPATLLPHLGKARLLARLLVLQAKMDVESGNPEAAVDHFARALLLARNVDEGFLVQMLVGDSIESLVVDAARSLQPKLGAPSRARFVVALSELPARTTFARAMSYERNVFAEWMRPIMTVETEKARTVLKSLGVEDDSPELEAILAGTKKERMQRFEEFHAGYGKMIEASKLPLPEASKEFDRLEKAMQRSSNPLIRLMTPSVGRANEKHAEVDARIEKLEAELRDADTSAGTRNSSRRGTSTGHRRALLSNQQTRSGGAGLAHFAGR